FLRNFRFAYPHLIVPGWNSAAGKWFPPGNSTANRLSTLLSVHRISRREARRRAVTQRQGATQLLSASLLPHIFTRGFRGWNPAERKGRDETFDLDGCDCGRRGESGGRRFRRQKVITGRLGTREGGVGGTGDARRGVENNQA